MKTLRIFLFPLFFLVVHTSFAQWQVVSSGTTKNLVDGCFVTDSTGFILSADGIILKTTDQGTSWTTVASLQGTFTSICNMGTDTLYAGGTRIFRSSDAGNTWTLVSNLGWTITDLIFFGAKTGFSIIPGTTTCSWAGNTFTLDDYKVYKTTDYGVSWQLSFYNGESTSRFQRITDSVAFIPGGQCFNYPHCCNGYENLSKRTHDFGATWDVAWQHPMGHSYASFIDPDTGYFISVGDRSKIYKTSNGGASLSSFYTDIPGNTVKDVRFINQIDAYLLSDDNIYVSASEGVAWTRDHIAGVTMNKFIYNPAHYLFCIGNTGTILKKHVTLNTHPDSVYRATTSTNGLLFGIVPADSTSILHFSLTNTGNTSVHVNIDAPADFQVGLSPSAFTNTLSVTLARDEQKAFYVRFHPHAEGTYQDTLVISGDHIANQYISAAGSAYAILYGNITKDTLICRDTLRIGSDITVEPGARLTLCPGMKVLFMDKYGMTIKGALVARGNPSEPITFMCRGVFQAWNGIHFQHANQGDTSFLSYCNMDMQSWTYPIFIDDSRVNMDHCNISNQKSTFNAIQLTGPNASLSISNSNLYMIGACAIAGNEKASCLIEDCSIYDNEAGICFNYPTTITPPAPIISLKNNIIYHNNAGVFISGSARVTGNRIYSNGSGLTVTNGRDSILVSNNEVFNNGTYSGGITLDYPLADAYIIQNLVYYNSSMSTNGAGIYINNQAWYTDSIFITGNTVCNNKVAEGNLGTELYVIGNCLLRDNILWNDSDTLNNVSFYKIADADVDYNCLGQRDLESLGPNNIISNPLFTRPTDFSGYRPGESFLADWSLAWNSPCINSGDTLIYPFIPPKDFAGNPRIKNGRIDIGAYEYQGSLSISEKPVGQEWRVYPNPVSGMLAIETFHNRPAEIRLFDVFSKMLISKQFSGSVNISMDPYPPGIYFYEIRSDNRLTGKGKIIHD